MLASLFRSTLTPAAYSRLANVYQHLRQKQVNPLLTAVFVLVWALAYTVLRLDGNAWRWLIARYHPCFAHLQQKRFRLVDPLRYLFQGLFLAVWQFPRVQVRKPVSAIFTAVIQPILKLRSLSHQYLNLRLPQLAAENPKIRRAMLLPMRKSFLRRGIDFWRLLVWIVIAVVTLSLIALLVSQPFNVGAQFVFVLLLWSAAMIIRRVPGRFSALLLIVLSLTVTTRYIWWRYTATLNWNSQKDIIFVLILLAAESYSWLVLLMGYIQTIWPLKRPIAPLPADTDQWPVVDILIPTYNEDLSVVKPTVYAALGIDWPKHKLQIHLLDDGRRPAFEAFAQEVGINYHTRADNRHAKAGNLNAALKNINGDLVAIFDCDHIPSRSFLQLTVGWFLRDKKLALLQTPHHFFSPDPFERNLGMFGKQPNENTLFYGLIQDGNDLWNGAFFCGSCAVLRRSSLDAIGGFAQETVTEDAHTALRLHRQGFNSAYLRIPMAAGLATESLSAHIGQRIRWARGMVQIFRLDNPLFGKGLSVFQRLCYANAMLHFLAGVPRLIYLTAPLAFLILHSYIIYAPVVLILLYVIPHMVHASLTNSFTQGGYRRTFWGEIYETVLAWYIALPTTIALITPKKGRFNVTEKGGLVEDDYFDWKIAIPYVVLTLLNVVGLGMGIWRLFTGPENEYLTVVITMLWVFYNLIILGGAIAVAVEGRQVVHRHRLARSWPISLQNEAGKRYSAILDNFSMQGVGVVTTAAHSFKQNDKVQLILPRGVQEFAFEGRIMRADQQHIGVLLSEQTLEKQIDFVQCTFARADAWLSAGQNFSLDRPVSSFADVLLICFKGYRRLATYMPYPLNHLVNFFLNFLLWIGSYIPRKTPVTTYEQKSA